MLRFATMNGAKALRLDKKVGSLTPGKEADIIILDATAINVAPLNQVPGAVVSLMDRTNVETVIVAGKVRKWKGQLARCRPAAPASTARVLARLYLLQGSAFRRTCSAASKVEGKSTERGRHQPPPFLPGGVRGPSALAWSISGQQTSGNHLLWTMRPHSLMSLP